jgi:hypothetical protein
VSANAETRVQGPSSVLTRHERWSPLRRGASGSNGADRRVVINWRFELLFLACTLCAVALILSYVGRQAGFPLTEASNLYLVLTQIYAAHFRHGDLFPIWSSGDAYGLGTPVLLFYQKAFLSVAGALDVILGNLKASLVLTMGLFLMVGSYGMRLAIGTLTSRKVLLIAGSVGFLFANYVFTDWLVRGDLPEFSALMIVPWLLYWCLKLVTRGAASLLIVPIMVLLVDTHNAIALLSLFTLAITFVIFVVTAGVEGLRKNLWRLVTSVVAVTVILAPMLVAELRFAKYYDPATKVQDFTTVFEDFADPVHYFYEGSYHWNGSLPHRPYFPVQIDFAIWISVLLGAILVLAWWKRSSRGRNRFSLARYVDLRALAVLGAGAFVYLFLQFRASSFVYRVFTPLKVIAFPSRGLAFITPIGVLLVVVVAEALFRRYPGNRVVAWLPAPWLASLILLSPVPSTTLPVFGFTAKFPNTKVNAFYPSTALSALPAYQTYGTEFPLVFNNGTLFQEYLPKVTTAQGREINPDLGVYENLARKGKAAQPLGSAQCSVVEPAYTPVESLNIQLAVKCDRATRLALPISYNAYTTITAVGPDGRRRSVPYMHLATDPRIIIDAPRDQREVLQVSLPTIWRVLF